MPDTCSDKLQENTSYLKLTKTVQIFQITEVFVPVYNGHAPACKQKHLIP